MIIFLQFIIQIIFLTDNAIVCQTTQTYPLGINEQLTINLHQLIEQQNIIGNSLIFDRHDKNKQQDQFIFNISDIVMIHLNISFQQKILKYRQDQIYSYYVFLLEGLTLQLFQINNYNYNITQNLTIFLNKMGQLKYCHDFRFFLDNYIIVDCTLISGPMVFANFQLVKDVSIYATDISLKNVIFLSDDLIEKCNKRKIQIFFLHPFNYLIQYCMIDDIQTQKGAANSFKIYQYSTSQVEFVFLQNLEFLKMDEIIDAKFFPQLACILILNKKGKIHSIVRDNDYKFFNVEPKSTQLKFIHINQNDVNISRGQFYILDNIESSQVQNILVFSQGMSLFQVDVSRKNKLKYIHHIQVKNNTCDLIDRFLLTRDIIIVQTQQYIYFYKQQNKMQEIYKQIQRNGSYILSYDNQMRNSLILSYLNQSQVINIQDSFLTLEIKQIQGQEDRDLTFQISTRENPIFTQNQQDDQIIQNIIDVHIQLVLDFNPISFNRRFQPIIEINQKKTYIYLDNYVIGKEISNSLIQYNEEQLLGVQIKFFTEINLIETQNIILLDSFIKIEKSLIFLLFLKQTQQTNIITLIQQNIDGNTYLVNITYSISANFTVKYAYIMNEKQILLVYQQFMEDSYKYLVWNVTQNKFENIINQRLPSQCDDLILQFYQIHSTLFAYLNNNSDHLCFISVQKNITSNKFEISDLGDLYVSKIQNVTLSIFQESKSIFILDNNWNIRKYFYFIKYDSKQKKIHFILQWQFKIPENCQFDIISNQNLILTMCPSSNQVNVYQQAHNIALYKKIELGENFPLKYSYNSSQKQGYIYLQCQYYDYEEQDLKSNILVINPLHPKTLSIKLLIESQDNFIYFPRIQQLSGRDKKEEDFIIIVKKNNFVLERILHQQKLQVEIKNNVQKKQNQTLVNILSISNDFALQFKIVFNLTQDNFLKQVAYNRNFSVDFWTKHHVIRDIIPIQELKGLENLELVDNQTVPFFDVMLEPIIQENNSQQKIKQGWNHDTVGFLIDLTPVGNYQVFFFSRKILISSLENMYNYTQSIDNPFIRYPFIRFDEIFYDNKIQEFENDLINEDMTCSILNLCCKNKFLVFCSNSYSFQSIFLYDISNLTDITSDYQFMSNSMVNLVAINQQICKNYQDFIIINSYDQQFNEKILTILRVSLQGKQRIYEFINIYYNTEQLNFFLIDISAQEYDNYYILSVLEEYKLYTILINSTVIKQNQTKIMKAKTIIYTTQNIQQTQIQKQKLGFISSKITYASIVDEICNIEIYIQDKQSMQLHSFYYNISNMSLLNITIKNKIINYAKCTQYFEDIHQANMSDGSNMLSQVCSEIYFRKKDVNSDKVQPYLLISKSKQFPAQIDYQLVALIHLPFAIQYFHILIKIKDQWHIIVPNYYNLFSVYNLNKDYTLVMIQNSQLVQSKIEFNIKLIAKNNFHESNIQANISINKYNIAYEYSSNVIYVKLALFIVIFSIMIGYLIYLRQKCKFAQVQVTTIQEEDDIFIIEDDPEDSDAVEEVRGKNYLRIN